MIILLIIEESIRLKNAKIIPGQFWGPPKPDKPTLINDNGSNIPPGEKFPNNG